MSYPADSETVRGDRGAVASVEPRLGWWSRSGFIAGAKSGKAELDKRNMNIAIYDVPLYGVTVVIARGQRAVDVRERLGDLFTTADPQGSAPDSASDASPQSPA